MSGIAGMGHPSDIQDPVSNQVAAAQLDEASAKDAKRIPANKPSLEDILGPQAQTAQPNARPSLDSILGPPTGSDTAQEASGPVDANLTLGGIGQQLSDFPARAKASFGVTEPEKLASLKQSFGDDNVRKVKDGFQVKDNGKWRNFSNSSGILDMIANNARPIAEGLPAGAMMGAGAAAAGAEGATGIGAAAIPATAIATNALAGAAGQATGDVIQNALGIPRDPNRNKAIELATAGAGNALFGGVAATVAGHYAASNAADVANSALKQGTADEVLHQQAQDTLAHVDQLKQNFGINMPVTQRSVIGDTGANEEAQSLAGTPQYQQAMRAIGKTLSDGWDKIANLAGDITGANESGKGTEALRKVADLDKVEGSLLGSYRQQAETTAGDKPLPVKSFQDAVAKTLQDLGYKKEGDQVITPSVESLQLKGVVDPNEAKQLSNQLTRIQEQLVNNNGTMTYDQIRGEYKLLSHLANKMDAYEFVNLKNGIRDDLTQQTQDVLKDTPVADDYAKSLARFTNIKNAHDTLGGMLDKDDTTAEALGSQLINNRNLDKLKAFKSLIQSESPETWDKIVGGYLKNLQTDATNPNTGTTNWAQVYKKFRGSGGLSDDVTKELWGDDGPQLLESFLKTASKLSDEQMSNMNAPSSQGAVKKLLSSAYYLSHGRMHAAVKLLTSIPIGQEGSLANYFDRANIDKLVAGLGPQKQNIYRSIINGTISGLSAEAPQAAMGAAVGQSAMQSQ